MCTLSFLPTKGGYIAAMNRDELRTRPPALPPAIHAAGELSLVYPRESSGGTWIGGNSRGMLLALLNWYSMETGKLGEKSRSRGEIIPAALQASDSGAAEYVVRRLELAGIYPFRLFGFFPGEQEISEWRWDTQRLVSHSHAWLRQHWFSSSRSDERAAAERGAACAQAWHGHPANPSTWLRELHASHVPGPGPFSVCVHREDAATVSYTEVEWKRGELQMRYQAGNPCEASARREAWSLPAPAIIQ
jgi:uncharacterized protein with NRDE domain